MAEFAREKSATPRPAFRGHFDQTGAGLPVLCLAGFGCANWIFEEMARELSGNAHFILPDNRGMGRSPAATEPYSIADLAGDALALMDDLGLEKFSVCGISMGGFIAQALYFQAPERVSALMLLCTLGPGPEFIPLPRMPEEALHDAYKLDAREMTVFNTDCTTYPGFATREPERYASIVERKLANLAQLDQAIYQHRAVQAFLEQPLPLERVTCPTLLMAGARDRIVCPENSRILHRKIPGSKLHMVEKTDHLFFLEKPEEVHTNFRHFLEEL